MRRLAWAAAAIGLAVYSLPYLSLRFEAPWVGRAIVVTVPFELEGVPVESHGIPTRDGMSIETLRSITAEEAMHMKGNLNIARRNMSEETIDRLNAILCCPLGAIDLLITGKRVEF